MMIRSAKVVSLLLPAVVLFAVFGVYVNSSVVQSTDSRWMLHLAASVAREGNLDLDEYHDLIPYGDYRVLHMDGHVYSAFPVGTSMLIVPLLYLHRGTSSIVGIDIDELSPRFEAVIASVFVSICVMIYYILCRRYLEIGRSLFLALVFAFCTSAWSTASRALWQHGPSMLMLCLTLYILLLAEDRPWLIQFAGLPLAYSFVIRPTNIVSVLFLTVFVLFRHKKYILGYLGLSMVVAICFVLLNLSTYRSLLPPYYRPGRIGANAQFFQALAGNLISPARGLLVFSPVFLLSFCGVMFKVKDGQLSKLDVTLVLIMVVHLLIVSSFPHWWAGHSFGPRFLTDVLPYMMYFMIPAVDRMVKLTGVRDLGHVLSVGFLTAFSFFVHFNGATNPATFAWNSKPVNVDQYPARLWDWGDPQFLRGFSVFGSFIAPRVVAEPSRILTLCRPDEQHAYEVKLELLNLRYSDFRWEANSPLGVGVSPRRGEGATSFSLLIVVPETSYPTGKHSLGEIKVTTRSQVLSGMQGVSVSVPVERYVVDELYAVFLPALANESMEMH